MAFYRLIPALLLLACLTSAQQPTLLPATLPACAHTCPVLSQAETGCIPPAAPVSNAGIYQSCFCQSGYLSSMRAASTTNICAPQCADADFVIINTFYKNFCSVGASGGQPTTIATLYPSTSTTLKPTPTPSAALGPVSGVNQGNNTSTNGKAWFSTHWRWVVMLIVLFIGLTLLAVIASILHKRHRRRREAAENAGPRPDIETWAPNGHSVHDFAAGSGNVAEKGKGREGAVTVQDGGVGGDGSRKLKKGLFRKSRG